MKFQISERRACRVVDQPRSCQRYVNMPRTDEAPLIKRMLELVRKRPRFGYRRSGRLLQVEGWRAGLVRSSVALLRSFRLVGRIGLDADSLSFIFPCFFVATAARRWTASQEA